MKGFNDELLKIHFTLYQGYVKNTNLIIKELSDFRATQQSRSYDYGAVKRRFGWEYDGMRLHEYYFDNLGGRGDPSLAPEVMTALVKQYGSYDAWMQDFIATGMMRGIGWAILCRDNNNGKLFNVWINEHDLGHLASATILLVMDVFEHAYITQYGLDREKYITAFFSNIDWLVVNKRSKS
ncbi:MAG: Fe-Mn family superoxide dismutase [Chlamydiae bacterium]|nr:Fe-Mn family superoxide dismutase [Chlamydiota bacterium]